jgi:hypothetical protein
MFHNLKCLSPGIYVTPGYARYLRKFCLRSEDTLFLWTILINITIFYIIEMDDIVVADVPIYVHFDLLGLCVPWTWYMSAFMSREHL